MNGCVESGDSPEFVQTGNKRMQYLAGFLSTISMFIGGNFIGWTSPVQIKLLNGETNLECSSENWSWAVASLTFATAVWAIAAGKFADFLGRRKTILLAAPLYLIPWIITYYAHSCYILLISRLIAAGGLAIASAVCAMYIGEITEKEIRGRVGLLVSFIHNTGVVFSLAVGPFVSYQTFLLILICFPILFFGTFYWMPESPYYQLKQGNRNAAMKSLMTLRGINDKKYLEQELDEMQRNVEEEMKNKSSFFELFKQPVGRKALFVVLGIKSIQQFSGITAIQSYMQKIFESTGSTIPSSVAGLICGVMQMIAGIFSTVFVDHFGRKPLLFCSSIGTALSLFSVGLYFFLQNIIKLDTSSIDWLPLVSIMVFMIIQPMGVGSLSYVYLSEVFPTNLKSNAAITAVMYSSFSAFLVTKLFDVIATNLDIFAPFWMCFIIIVIGILFIIFYVPETKGKTLIEIQVDLKAISKKEPPAVETINL